MEYTIIDILFVAGRVLYGGFFLMSGWNHLKNSEALSGYAASKGVPSPKAAVMVSGLMILFGGLGIILGVYPEVSVTLIAVFLVIVSFKMHDYWLDTDPAIKMANQINFMKNMALLGAALMFLSLPETLGSRAASAWPLPLF